MDSPTSPNRADRHAAGKSARAKASLDSHRAFEPAVGRDPVGLLMGQATTRVPELVPIRHERMLVSPFTFFRGAALPMAADLSTTPSPGLRVQLCGDAHLANFGAYASPERRLVFDINDFDETLPGPFEWDVKRFAASLAVAGRDNDLSRKARRAVVLAGVGAYRLAMREFAQTPTLAVWYTRFDVEDALKRVQSRATKSRVKWTKKAVAKARTRDSMQSVSKLTTVVAGQRRIISDPPLITPVEDVFSGVEADATMEHLQLIVHNYSRTLSPHHQHLVQQFRLTHAARKVVGVGSVGTRAWILLLEGHDGTQPLVLQAKEAQPSVLAAHCGRSRRRNQGQRVVEGQQLMQAVSDIFLGWQRVRGSDGAQRDFYVRQLRDWKLSVPIERLDPAGMQNYARLCGWTLARAHARAGDRIAIAAYLGKTDRFDNAIADFAELYADQTELDYAALAAVVTAGA